MYPKSSQLTRIFGTTRKINEVNEININDFKSRLIIDQTNIMQSK